MAARFEEEHGRFAGAADSAALAALKGEARQEDGAVVLEFGVTYVMARRPG